MKVTQQKKSYDFEIKGAKVFATCNEIKRQMLKTTSITDQEDPPPLFSGTVHRSIRQGAEEFIRSNGQIHRFCTNGGYIRDVISVEVN